MIRRSRSRVRTALALAGAALLAVSACTTAQEEQARLNGEAAACPVEPDPSVRATVRIGWQAIPTGDLIVQERHLLESCLPSATIQWVQFDGGDDVVQAFGSGSIDLGISGSSAAVTAMSPPLELPVRLVVDRRRHRRLRGPRLPRPVDHEARGPARQEGRRDLRGHPTFDLISARAEFVEAEPAFMEMWTRLQDHAATEIAEDPDAAAE